MDVPYRGIGIWRILPVISLLRCSQPAPTGTLIALDLVPKLRLPELWQNQP